jgi:hypothetical protein
MGNFIQTCTNRAFMELSHQFETLTIEEQVRSLLEHGTDGEGFLTPMQREIDGKTYGIGFLVEREEQAQRIAQIFI